jgi:hypothetical protein
VDRVLLRGFCCLVDAACQLATGQYTEQAFHLTRYRYLGGRHGDGARRPCDAGKPLEQVLEAGNGLPDKMLPAIGRCDLPRSLCYGRGKRDLVVF